MQSWDYDQPNILEVRFEEFTTANYETLIKIFSFLELLKSDNYDFPSRVFGLYRDLAAHLNRRFNWLWPGAICAKQLPVPELLTIAWRNSFQVKSKGRKVGDEDTHSHYRKGKPGDWENYFGDQHKKLFKELYAGLVPKLRYHPDDDW
jgi:hypothetical protein